MSLLKDTIKLAYDKPHLRPLLLPIIKKAKFDPNEISKLEKGPLHHDADETYMENEFTEQETEELRMRQQSGDLNSPEAILKPMHKKAEEELRKATIRLAYENKELRPALLKAIKLADEEKKKEEMEDKDAAMIHHVMNSMNQAKKQKNKGKKKSKR